MKALIYQGPGKMALEERPIPDVTAADDAIVKIAKTTICGTAVHGAKVDLHLERLWAQNITITTRLVDTVTTPMLLKTVQSLKLDPKLLITHRFNLDQKLEAYDTFGRAASTHALKVLIET